MDGWQPEAQKFFLGLTIRTSDLLRLIISHSRTMIRKLNKSDGHYIRSRYHNSLTVLTHIVSHWIEHLLVVVCC